MQSKFFKFLVPVFYLFAFAFLIVGGYLLYRDQDAFYLDDKEITMPIESNYTIHFIGKDNENEYDNYIFTSTDESVVKVDEKGQVTAKGIGEAEIRVTSKNKNYTQSLIVKVSEDNLYLIEFETEELLLKEKEQIVLKPLINGEKNYDVDINYSSSDSKIASVDQKGKVTAKKSGISYITARIKGTNKYTRIRIMVKSLEKEVVKDNKVNDNTTEKPTTTRETTYTTTTRETTTTMHTTTKPINSSQYTTTNKTTKPTSTTKNTTTTTKNTTTTTKKPTTTKKVDDDEGNGYDEEVNTHIYVKNVELSASKSKLKVGETLKLTYKVIPENATNKKVTFSSNDTSVATVDSKGTVTAKKAGTVDISIKTDENKYTRFVTLTIEENTVNVTSIALNKSQTSILVDGTEKLTYTINPSNATNKKVTWKSSNTTIVTVDSSGNIKGIAPGNATITVTTNDGSKTSQCNVTVKEKPISITGVSLDKTSLTLNPGGTAKLNVTITPSNATNQKITFKSNNTSVATVDASGNVKAVGAGTTNITVTTNDGNKTAKCTVTVNEILVTAITLNKSDFQMALGSSNKIIYSITPMNATNQTIKWTVDNTNVVTVSQDGTINAVGLGKTNVTAKNTKSGVSTKIAVVVAPKDKLINIKNSSYNKFQHNIGTLEDGTYKHMQNFAISNIGKDNQVIYLSTVQGAAINSTKYPTLTNTQKADLTRTIVYKVTKANISDPSKRTKMYLENAGHGQSFDMEPDSDIIWTNYNSYIEENNGYYWGHAYEIMRIKFKATAKKASYTPLLHTIVKDNSGKEYTYPAPAVDKENNLLLMKVGNTALIYDYKEFIKGNQVVIYKFRLNPQITKYADGSSISRQGIALKGGYVYDLKGAPGKDAYIEAYNLLGESLYYKKLNDGTGYSILRHREPEGLHVYNNKLYIGSTHYRSNDVKESLYDLGYYSGS